MIYEPFWNSIWTNSPEGKNTFWSNMGGYFVSDQMNANGFASAVYYDGTVEEVLSMMYVEVKAGGGGGADWSSLGSFNIGRRVQDHVYRNSSLYQYHRDQMKERQMDEFQEGMDYLGTFDPTFLVDGLNGLGYLFRGQYGNAAIAGIAMVPFVGDLGKLGKVAKGGSHLVYESSNSAFKAAKKANNIPVSSQPLKTFKIPDKHNSQIMLRVFEYRNINGELIHIRKDIPTIFQGPHFNSGPAGQKLKQHFYYKP